MGNLFLKLKEKKFLIRFFFLFLIIAGLTVPLVRAHAWIFSLADAIGGAIVAYILNIVLSFAVAFLGIASLLLTWVTSPGFISLPYTSGGIVDIGWTLTRDLVNMGFVFALLIIGLATALRYKDYQAKKTLPTLIAMVLLVNFTPVICGVIVDAGNIVMNFFLQGVSSFDMFLNIASSQFGAILTAIFSITSWATGHIDLIIRTMALTAFCIISGLFLLLYAFLFIIRYVAIWILVILSPFAFFANVLPMTRKYFSAWWSQLLQWSFVGVVAAFFLYLAGQLTVFVEATPVIGELASTLLGGPMAAISNAVNPLLKYGVVLALLLFGFFATLASGAIGANAVIASAKGWAKSGVNNAGKWTQKKTKELGAGVSSRAGRAIIGSEQIGKTLDQLTSSKEKGIGGWAARQLGLMGKTARGKAMDSFDKIKDPAIDAIINAKDPSAAAAYFSNPLMDPSHL